MVKDLFSVILLHYNQREYYKTAIDSVLSQNYENIELIFADDCTQGIDKNEIEEYINANKKSNLFDFSVLIPEENRGTVKNANNALKQAKGKYILFFAADDALCNEIVLSNFVEEFQKADEDVLAISFQLYLYDSELKETIGEFVKPNIAMLMNSNVITEQFEELTTNCYIPIGSTAFKKKCFEVNGYFNEKYKIIEDWAYFLKTIRNGTKYLYKNHDGLKHRSGGVSHYEGNDLPPHVIEYVTDTLKIIENEVFPFMKIFSMKKQNEIFEFYDWVRKNQELQIGYNNELESRRSLRFKYKKLYNYRKKAKCKGHIIYNSRVFLNAFVTTIFIWILLCLASFYMGESGVDISSEFTFLAEKILAILLAISASFTGIAFVILKFVNIISRLIKVSKEI